MEHDPYTCTCFGCSIARESKIMQEQEEDPNPEFDNMGYICSKCGCPITAAEGDDNGGMCENCAGDS